MILEHGHKLKSSFWVQSPLQSKSVNSCAKEVETLRSILCGFTQMLTDRYVESARMRVIRMFETALTSNWYYSNEKWFRIEIVRNQ